MPKQVERIGSLTLLLGLLMFLGSWAFGEITDIRPMKKSVDILSVQISEDREESKISRDNFNQQFAELFLMLHEYNKKSEMYIQRLYTLEKICDEHHYSIEKCKETIRRNNGLHK